MTRSVFRHLFIMSSLFLSSTFIVPAPSAQSQPTANKSETASSSTPWIGILLDKKTAFSSDGILVERVMRKSPAAKAGILAGDRILSVGDQEVQSAGKLQMLVRGQAVGETIKVRATREDKPIDFQVTLTPAPTQTQIIEDQLLNQPAPSVSLQILRSTTAYDAAC